MISTFNAQYLVLCHNMHAFQHSNLWLYLGMPQRCWMNKKYNVTLTYVAIVTGQAAHEGGWCQLSSNTSDLEGDQARTLITLTNTVALFLDWAIHWCRENKTTVRYACELWAANHQVVCQQKTKTRRRLWCNHVMQCGAITLCCWHEAVMKHF